MAEQIGLVYSLYLDVPMMTSFVSALEDGTAYGFDITQARDRRRTVSAEGEGIEHGSQRYIQRCTNPPEGVAAGYVEGF